MTPLPNKVNLSKADGTETDRCLSLTSPAYAMSTDQMLAACEVNAEKGLSGADVQRRRQLCGSNRDVLRDRVFAVVLCHRLSQSAFHHAGTWSVHEPSSDRSDCHLRLASVGCKEN